MWPQPAGRRTHQRTGQPGRPARTGYRRNESRRRADRLLRHQRGREGGRRGGAGRGAGRRHAATASSAPRRGGAAALVRPAAATESELVGAGWSGTVMVAGRSPLVDGSVLAEGCDVTGLWRRYRRPAGGSRRHQWGQFDATGSSANGDASCSGVGHPPLKLADRRSHTITAV